jgi:hypothetical protein
MIALSRGLSDLGKLPTTVVSIGIKIVTQA